MNRRALISAAPAAMMVGAMPVQAAAPEMSLADKILHHVAEIQRLLQEAAPENVTFTGAQWVRDHTEFWASGVWNCPSGEYGAYRLAHFRPAVKPDWWIEAAPRIAGG